MILNKKITLILAFASLLFAGSLGAAPAYNHITGEDIAERLISPFNGKKIDSGAWKDGYSFFVIGHPYGNYYHKKSVYPASTLLANVNPINAAKPSFIVTLGDIMRRFDEPYISLYKSSFTRQVDAPVFNAVGNYDMSRGPNKYFRYFGPDYYYFIFGSEIFIFLNVGVQEEDEISDKQMAFINEIFERVKLQKSIKNVFVFTHRLVWAEDGYEKFSEINKRSNFPSKNSEFRQKIYPILKKLSESRNIFVGSGDIGQNSPPIFYHYDIDDNITYFATGLNDSEKDSMIEIRVSKDSRVAFSPVSLTRGPLKKINNYGISAWEKYKQKPVDWGK